MVYMYFHVRNEKNIVTGKVTARCYYAAQSGRCTLAKPVNLNLITTFGSKSRRHKKQEVSGNTKGMFRDAF